MSVLDTRTDVERLSLIAKALSEPVRVRIVDVLRDCEEPVCQCELNERFALKQPVMSHHMRKLVDAGVVTVERRHRWAFYSVRRDALDDLAGWLGR